jgi:acetoin utilization deacetylase AcuC-like enzyme
MPLLVANDGTDVLVVSLGLDTVAGDPDSRPGHGFAFTIADYARMGSVIRSTGLQVLVVQEGGYHLPQVPRAVLAFLTALVSGGGGGDGDSKL